MHLIAPAKNKFLHTIHQTDIVLNEFLSVQKAASLKG